MMEKILIICIPIFLALAKTNEAILEKCWKDGQCHGHLIDVHFEKSKEDCLTSCKNYHGCEWVSFNQDKKFCQMNKACYQVLPLPDYVVSKKNCIRKYIK
jgi:hypothetical protein